MSNNPEDKYMGPKKDPTDPFEPVSIHAITIPDAWFQLVYNLFDYGYIQYIQSGSFENTVEDFEKAFLRGDEEARKKLNHRIQYPGASIYIKMPSEDMVPIMPEGSNIPAPTTLDYITLDYFPNYLMNPVLAENETYKYASRIHHPMPGKIDPNANVGERVQKIMRHAETQAQRVLADAYDRIINQAEKDVRGVLANSMGNLSIVRDQIPNYGTQYDRVIDMLRKTPLTNQATMEVGSPDDLDVCYGKDGKLDPPCLRLIDFKVVPVGEKKYLTAHVVFRSWDLWAGLPSNLGGIELLKQTVASETDLLNGPMYAYSPGLHIYKYHEEVARLRAMRPAKNGNLENKVKE